MNYIIVLTYRDEKQVHIEIKEDQLNSFMEAMKNKELFWQEHKYNGFYANMDDIRFIHVVKKEDEEKPQPKKEVSSPHNVSLENEQ